jgi:hypothetical protein
MRVLAMQSWFMRIWFVLDMSMNMVVMQKAKRSLILWQFLIDIDSLIPIRSTDFDCLWKSLLKMKIFSSY